MIEQTNYLTHIRKEDTILCRRNTPVTLSTIERHVLSVESEVLDDLKSDIKDVFMHYRELPNFSLNAIRESQ